VNKEELREVYLRKRKQLTEKEYQRRNSLIKNYVVKLLASLNIQSVHLFLPIIKNREINTWAIIDEIKSRYRLIISKSSLKDNTMNHYLFEDNIEFTTNKWGIPEPENGMEVMSDVIDSVLVPLVIFDKNGGRIGYGKGYYDRFLSKCRSSTIKIGLSLSPPVDKIDYLEDFDVKLDYAVTHLGVYNFNHI